MEEKDQGIFLRDTDGEPINPFRFFTWWYVYMFTLIVLGSLAEIWK